MVSPLKQTRALRCLGGRLEEHEEPCRDQGQAGEGPSSKLRVRVSLLLAWSSFPPRVLLQAERRSLESKLTELEAEARHRRPAGAPTANTSLAVLAGQCANGGAGHSPRSREGRADFSLREASAKQPGWKAKARGPACRGARRTCRSRDPSPCSLTTGRDLDHEAYSHFVENHFLRTV